MQVTYDSRTRVRREDPIPEKRRHRGFVLGRQSVADGARTLLSRDNRVGGMLFNECRRKKLATEELEVVTHRH